MNINEIFIKCDNPYESKTLLNYFLTTDNFYYNGKIPFIKKEEYLNKNQKDTNLIENKAIFYKLSLKDNNFLFDFLEYNFKTSFDKRNYLEKELLKKSLVISFKEFELNNFNCDFEIYTKEYKNKKMIKEINEYIQWQLEANNFDLDKNLFYKGEKDILIKNKPVNFLEFIEATDNLTLLNYAYKNYNLRNKIDFNNLNFNENAIKCNKFLNELKKEIELTNNDENFYIKDI